MREHGNPLKRFSFTPTGEYFKGLDQTDEGRLRAASGQSDKVCPDEDPPEKLQPEDRLTIASLLQRGRRIREIAGILARPAATIRREIKPNTCARRGYASRRAQALAHPCPRLAAPSLLKMQVLTMLSWKWSPQQISATLKRMPPTTPAPGFRTRRSTTRRTRIRAGNCAASCWPVFAGLAANAGLARPARTVLA